MRIDKRNSVTEKQKKSCIMNGGNTFCVMLFRIVINIVFILFRS